MADAPPQGATEEAAALLRAAGWTVKPPRPPPVTAPRIGMRVRYLRGGEWGPKVGDVGTVVAIRESDPRLDGFATEPVFWVRLDSYPSGGGFYTLPRYVEELPDAE